MTLLFFQNVIPEAVQDLLKHECHPEQKRTVILNLVQDPSLDEMASSLLLGKDADLHRHDTRINQLLFNCSCILFTLSDNFSEVRFSRILSTLIGKQKGVSRVG